MFDIVSADTFGIFHMLHHSFYGGGTGRGFGVWAGLEFMVNTIKCVLNEGGRD